MLCKMSNKGLASLLLAGLCGVAQAFPTQTYVTENFTAPGFQVTRAGKTEPGYLFYGVVGKGYIPLAPIIMQNNGDLVWYGGQASTHNMRVQQYKGNDVLTYWSGYGDPFGHGYGSIYLFDTTYTLINKVTLDDNIVTPNPDAFPGNRPNPSYFDGHESYVTDRGTVIATCYNVTRADLTQFKGPKNGWVFDALFYEVDIETNKILFRWSALENIPLSKSNYLSTKKNNPLKLGKRPKGFTRDQPWDFFHINSVQPIKGGYLVNSRMTWSFYKVSDTDGHVIWTLEGSQGGDFTLGPGIFYSWQHMPRIESVKGHHTHISVFNNDNINAIVYGTNQSTGYLLDVNMQTKHVTALQNFKDDSFPIYSGAEGSYQKLGNGHALLGYGSMAVIKEFNNKGKVVYTAQFAPLTNQNPDQDRGKDVHSYRAYRYEWTAQPTYPPKAAGIQQSGGSVEVYMSWNGATTVDSWNIYAGTDQNDVLLVSSNITKTGFETMSSIGLDGVDVFKYVQVEALGGGKSLAMSDVVQVQGGSGGGGGK